MIEAFCPEHGWVHAEEEILSDNHGFPHVEFICPECGQICDERHDD